MAREREFRMACRDAVGRPGEAVVIVRDDEVVVSVPAGEAAVFRTDQVDEGERLRMALALGLCQLREGPS